VRVSVLPLPLGCAFADLDESWRAAEDSGFHGVWAIDHATATPELTPAWEATSLLVAMAARTRAIPIGVLVFDALLRHPFVLAGSVAVAQAVSGGRVRVGLGIGDEFSRLDHVALGLPFPPFAERVSILEASCRVLPALWRGETVTEPLLGLTDATFGPPKIEAPPIVVGGGSRRVIDVAARHAQGWNLFTQEPDTFASRLELLAHAEAAAGRAKPLSKSVYLFADRVDRELGGVLNDFETRGADEAILVVQKPSAASIRNLARQVL
jgi:alkanesulfonate monooxygenase SsuD/methylene tetrahydromethanopterin reductase-like flavin-dependent oxidoreductase (luciferase family)